VNSRQLAQVGLGLIGVWALLDALNGFMTVAAFVRGEGGPAMLSVAVPVLLLLGLSYVLVFHNSRLAATIAPEGDATVEHGTPDLARVLVALLGVMLLVQAIPRVLNAVLAYLAAGEYPDVSSRALPLRSFLGTAVQVAIALYLIVRPERLLDYLRRPRHAQTD
jgi:hypothetical protein